MSVKNLFNKRLNNKVVTKTQADNLTNDIESAELVSDVVKSENTLIPHVDFSDPKNFSRYGSAEKYYEDSFARVYKTFPYDGSTSEIQKWQNESSYLDRWIFDNAYPKSTGYVKLGTNQSVTAKGGPNNQPGVTEGEAEELSKQFPVKSGNSNIWDTSIYRNSNLYIDGALGNTVEFWAKLESTFSGSFVTFNVGNEAQSIIMSVRFRTTDGLLTLVYRDDTASGLSTTTNIVDLITTTWSHLAFSFVNEGGQVKVEVYKNGTRVHTQATGTAIGSVTQVDSKLNINGTSTGTLSADGFYVDEFRFWKQRRTEEQIGRHWFTQVTGGTNTDNNKYSEESNIVDLGIYYKFNEGITTDDSIDATVLDYSGRISNGTIANYSSTVRNTGSAINESGLVDADDYELPDPIVYSTHPSYVSALEEYKLLGQTHDYTNNASIYHTMPAWILEEDDVNGQNIKELTQVISSHFDDTHLRISELTNLKNNEYYSLEEESDKPFFFVNRALESTGLIVPDLFVEATAFEEILSRGEQELFDEKIQDIKNVIYQNIYNNVSYIYKSKGAEKAFRNLIRCFGVDDELIKINLYSDNSDYTLEDTRRTTAIKKNVVDFNDPDRNDALVYSNEVAARAETSSFIPGVPSAKSNLISLTFEAEAIFPKRLSVEHPNYVSPTGLEKQIAMLGEADSLASGDAVYQASINPIFSIYAKKDDATSENIKFALSSTLLGADIETDATYKETYDNSKWNFAVRLSPIKEIGDTVLGGATSDYNLEFYGVKMLADEVEEEFTKTTVITSSNARAAMELAKFVSVGALKTDADPTNATTVRDTDIKVSSVRFWYDYLSDAEIKGHASDASNFGRLNPNADAYAFVTSLSSGLTTDIRVPRKDTLALFWDFSNVTAADSSGEFIVEDLSDRITDGRYGWFTDLLDKQITGRGRRFLADDKQVVNKEFLYSAKHRTPEVLNSEDLIEIRTQDDDKFTRESRPITHFFAAEKSMYQVIDDDIINLFASIVEFNDLIGQPVNRYRMNYKALEKFRQLYFQKVQNVPSLEKYVHFYKWLDSSIGMMIEQLIPISSNFSSTLRTMVENHTLERNKYWTKFPTLEMKQDIPEGQLRGIREMLYDWESGSAPITKVAEFDGAADFINVPDADSLSFGDGTTDSSFSIAAWVYIPTTVSSPGTIVSKYNSFASNSEYYLQHDPFNQLTLVMIDTSAAVSISAFKTGAFTLGKWQHLVVTFDSTEADPEDGIEMYIDGTLQSLDNRIGNVAYVAMENGTAPVRIGTLATTTDPFEGKMSNLAFFNRDLTQTEVTDLYNGGIVLDLVEHSAYNDVISWWKFGEGDTAGADKVIDQKGSNNGTLNGDTAIVRDLALPSGDACLWNDERVERTDPGVTSGVSTVDDDRETIRNVAVRDIKGQTKVVKRGSVFVEEASPILYDHTTTTSYEGSTYAVRRLSKPYKFGVDKALTIRGGANYAEITKDPNEFIRASTTITTGTSGIELNGVEPNPETCYDKGDKEKFRRAHKITLTNSVTSTQESLKGSQGMFPRYGETPTGGAAELTNIHNDSYGDDAEIPIQGPFTNQWVGGNQHRHVYLATPAADRPELYLNVSDTLRHPHEVDPNNPSARYTRDELAKRPLNIENIKFEEGEPGPLGNYSRVYQVVQTSGRTQNNRFLVRNPDYSIVKQASSAITDAFDFTLPNRDENADATTFGRTEHVFVERFSAPGDPLTVPRGQMDVEAEEFSSYNSLNFRNLTVRTHLNFWQTQHSAVQSGSQGYRLMEGFNTGLDGVAAYQKNNRNPSVRMSLKIQDDPSNHSGSYGCITNYDNFFIGHQLPRSDFQYAWVTASALPDSSVIDCDNLATVYPRLGGYVSGYSNASIDITFVSQSYNPLVTKTLSIESGLVEPSGSVMPLSGSGDYTPNDLFLDRNGPYQGASWKLFRGQDRPLVIEQRRQNTISVISRSDENTFENYVEPVVTWNLQTRGSIGELTQVDAYSPGIILTDYTASYSNNLEFFANPNLRERVSVVKDPVQFYDQVMSELRNVDSNLGYKEFIYSEIVYPKHRNVGLTKIRERAKLDDYNVFWKDKFLDRIRKDSNPNKLGWATIEEKKNFLKQKNSNFSMDNFYYSQTLGGVETVYNVIGDLSYVGEQRYFDWIKSRKHSTLPDSALTTTTSGLESLPAAEPATETVVRYSSDAIKETQVAPTPAAQLYYNPLNGGSRESGWISRTSELSDNSPAYNDYDSYNLELRSIGQNYGILSEFRISQHMDKYVNEQGGDFRAKNYNFLSLDGASYDANRHEGKTHTQFSGKTVTTKDETVYSLSGFENERVTIGAYPSAFSDVTNVINNAAKVYADFNPIKASETFTLENSILTGRKIGPTYALGREPVFPYMSGYNAAAKFNLSSTSDDFLAVRLNKVSQTSDNQFLKLSEKAFTFSIWAQPDSSLQNSRDNSAIATLGNKGSRLAGNYESIVLMSRFKHPNGVKSEVHSSDQLGLTVVFSDSKDVVNGEFNKILTTSSVYCFFNSDGTPAFLKPDEFNHVAFQLVPFLNATRPMMIKMWLNGVEVYGVHAKAIDTSQVADIYGYSPCPVGKFPTASYPWGENLDTDLNLESRIIDRYALGCGSFSHSLGNKLEANERMSFSGLLDEHSLWTGILSEASLDRLYNNGIPGNILEDKENSDIFAGYTSATTKWDINYSTNGITIDDTGTSVTNPNLAFEYSLVQTQANFDLPVWHRIGVPYVEKTETCDGWDDEFFNSYVHTDNVKFLEKVVDDHEALGRKPRLRVNLKVSAIKKLLPYEGFYPQDRTVQIASLFSDKISKISDESSTFFKEQQVQTALQHFFAPGILYNSIKAGLSVDWASFTDKTGLEQNFVDDNRTVIGSGSFDFATYAPNWYAPRTDRNDVNEALGNKPGDFADSNLAKSQPSFKQGLQGNGFVILQEPDTRLPFEALLNPRDYLSRTSRAVNLEGQIFHHSDLEIFDWNAEGTFLTISHVEEGSNGSPEVKTTRVSIGDPNVPVNEGIDWDVKVDFRRTPEGLSIARRNSTTGEVERTSANQFSTSQSEITSARLNEEIAVKLCRAINKNQELSVIAIPGTTPNYTFGQSRSDDIIGSDDKIAQIFEETYKGGLPQLFEGANLGIQTNGSWKIRLFYVGPDSLPSLPSEEGEEAFRNKEEEMDSMSFTGGSEKFKNSGKTYGELTTIQSTRVMGVLNSTNSFDGNTMIGWSNYSIASELGLKILNSNGNIDFSSISSSNTGSGFLDATIFGMTTELRQGEQGQVVQSDRATTQGPISFYNPVERERDQVEKNPFKFYLMTPEYYSLKSKLYGEELEQFSYPSFEWSDESSSDIRYELAINNFLAEVPKFFLKNQGLTTIASKPENEFKAMTAGKTYYMDVSVQKTRGFEIALSPTSSEGRYFGPSFKWKKLSDYSEPKDLVAGPAQAPYVPPYLHGKSTTRMSFVPSESRTYTLEEILSGLSTEDITEEQHNYFESQASGSYFEDTPAWKSRMTVRSSFNLTGKARVKKTNFDTSVSVAKPLSENQSQAVVTSAVESEGTAYDTWVISPKFECPVLNFNNAENGVTRVVRQDAGVYEIKQEETLNYEGAATSVNYKVSNDKSAVSTDGTPSYESGTGTWAGYGSIPQQSEGIFVSIEESFSNPGNSNRTAGSLIDVCGFTATQEKIGDIAESREISEAIVMIPFLDRGDAPLSQYIREGSRFNSNVSSLPINTASATSTNGRTIAPVRIDPTPPIRETEGQQVRTTKVDGRNFISITKENFLAQKSNIENGLPAITSTERADLGEPKQETTISRMIKMMKKYNLPPRYDFITYPMSAGENPFVMYFFEFTQTLGKQDLADIWQGVKPEIANKAVRQEKQIIHDLGPSEFFEGNEIPSDIRWMVFKVKRKASADYFEMAKDSREDSRFKFDFKVGKKKPEYSYNYPYDFFSLIEMAKIESGIEIETDPEDLVKDNNRNQE